jgi:DNA-binding GntR family transcriptional regulator
MARASQARVATKLETGAPPVEEAEPVSRHRTLSTLAYERFKTALFERRIEAGAFMSQSELVALLDVPLGPVRDALQALQAEGLVIIRARSGIEIAKADFALIRNTYQLRFMLERQAVRRFAEVGPLARMKAMEAEHQALAKALRGREITPGEAHRVSQIDLGFHQEVMGVLANPLAERAYKQTHDFVQLIRADRLYGLSFAMILRTVEEHIAIIRACRARDPAAAEAALEAHFARAMQRAMAM